MIPTTPSAIGIVREWIRANPPLAALTGTRQYFSMPRDDRPQTPFLLLYRVGGTPDDMGQDYPQMIIECWADTKTAADDLGIILAAEINAIRYAQVESGEVCAGRTNIGPIESTGTPYAKRSRVDATFHTRKVF